MVNSSEIEKRDDKSSLKRVTMQEIIYFSRAEERQKKVNRIK
jgi:hypothetical protein